jgi:tetratricopeptide (TPR) repeat protein
MLRSTAIAIGLAQVLFAGCNLNAGATGDASVETAQRLMKERRFAEALPLLHLGLKKPLEAYSRSDVLTMIGNCHNELDELDKALEFHQRALDEDPRNYKVLVNMGIVYRLKGDYDQASQYYRRALQLAPDYAELHASMGALCLFQDQYESAIEHLERAVELDDSLAVAHSNLAVAYASVGRFDEAEAELKKAVIRGYHQPKVIQERIDQLRELSAQRE